MGGNTLLLLLLPLITTTSSSHRYNTKTSWVLEAPYRTCTVRDTLSDLPRYSLVVSPRLTLIWQDRERRG